jgi:hypothetical protein
VAIPAAETAPTRNEKGVSSRRRRPLTHVRAKRVAFDGARKRGARMYTNWGLEAPRASAPREVEEYDRKMEMAAAARGSRSSSGAGISTNARALLQPPKREEEEQGAARATGAVIYRGTSSTTSTSTGSPPS